MSTIIQCPNCATRYRLKFTIEDGQQVRCPACQTVWRFQSEPEPEQSALFAAPEPNPAEAPASPRAAAEEAAQHEAGPLHASYDDDPSAYQSQAEEEPSAEDEYGDPSQQAAYEGFGAAPDMADEPEQQTAGEEEARPPHAAASWGSSVVGDDYAFEDRAADFIRGPAIPSFSPTQDEESGETSNWAAELAGAINRAGYERRGPMGPDNSGGENDSAFDDDAGNAAYQSAAARDSAQAEDENQHLAAEKLSAFWRGERAAAAFEEDEFKGFGGGMPVRQPEDGEARPRGGLALVAAWGSYIAIMSGAVASIALFPEHVVDAMPGAATYYEQAGIPVAREPLGFENVTYEWLKRDGRSVLEVRGDVINMTDDSLRVPLLHISVRDDQSAEIAKTVAIIVKEPLAPSAKTPFTLEFLSPPKSISGIELQFGS